MTDNLSKEIKLKALIVKRLIETIDEKAAIVKSEIQLAIETRDNETKSNVGDKYETTREMMQLEIEKNMLQLNKYDLQKNELLKINIQKTHKKVELGSLVFTPENTYFISIGLGKIEIENERESCGEKLGDLRIFSSQLKNIEIDSEIIPNIIDEIPILSVAGLFADGKFNIRNAKELRFKESDRIEALCSNFKKLGVVTEEFDDGFSLSGNAINVNVLLESFKDHRIAMAFAVLGMLIGKEISINDFESVAVSNPKFLDQINSIKLA